MTQLIDIHCHGGGGHSFGETVESTLAAAAAHRSAGTAGIVASLVSMPVAQTLDQITVIRSAMEHDPSILGIHLEGPFLSPARRGAHDERSLARPSRDAAERLVDGAGEALRQVTIAPELPGALAAIEFFVSAGVTVAVGHTEADAAIAREAFARGASLITHAFNAMSGITGRAIGPVGAALADERVRIEVIADGLHVDSSLIPWLFRAAPGRIVLVTDAMAAAGMGDGTYSLGSTAVEVRHGHAVIAGTDTLAGSTLTLAQAVENCVAAGVPREDALIAASDSALAAISVDC